MYENREASWTPRPDRERGRSAKATSHKADMHVQEESDRSILPMNQPNKGAAASAEVGEGRGRTKENIAQSNTRPTQSGERVSQGLRGVRQAAVERRQERLTALLHQDTRWTSRTVWFRARNERSCMREADLNGYRALLIAKREELVSKSQRREDSLHRPIQLTDRNGARRRSAGIRGTLWSARPGPWCRSLRRSCAPTTASMGCGECEEPISPKRLAALPWARYCLHLHLPGIAQL